jgi:hypothetical protein
LPTYVAKKSPEEEKELGVTLGQGVGWYGYEASPPAVAKALVITALLEGGADVNDIMQVWYSSAWRDTALAAFKAAVKALLAGLPSAGSEKATGIDAEDVGAAGGPEAAASLSFPPERARELMAKQHPKVIQLLQHWNTVCSVPLADTWKGWLDRGDSGVLVETGNFLQPQDRLAYLHYTVTGYLDPKALYDPEAEKGGEPTEADVLDEKMLSNNAFLSSVMGSEASKSFYSGMGAKKMDKAPPAVSTVPASPIGTGINYKALPAPVSGNITMFSVSAGPGKHMVPKESGESFFHGLEWSHLWAARTSTPDIVSAGSHLIRIRLRRLQRRVKTGEIVIREINLQRVTPETTEVNCYISSLHPWTISWSNVPDYIEPEDFWKLAKACSGPNQTAHSFYSMNWRREVLGCFTLDLQPEGRLRTLELAKQTMSHLYFIDTASVVPGLEALMGEKPATRTLKSCLMWPPVDNAMNLVDTALSMAHRDAWVAAFVSLADPEDFTRVERQVMTESLPYRLMARTNGIIIVAFTFDDTLTVNGDPHHCITRESVAEAHTSLQMMRLMELQMAPVGAAGKGRRK